jgi:O-antigen/teichoic acid export membrane protein
VATLLQRTGARQVARNVGFNLAGVLIPMVAAVVAIPLLVAGLGAERFGLLTLTWLVIGYFGLFDLGLSRALAQLVAERLGAEREDEIPAVVWTGLALTLGFSLVGALLLALLAPWLVYRVLEVPPALEREGVAVFRIIAGVLPFVIGSTALAGVLEARQRFDLLNALRVPLGIFAYVAPLCVLPFSHGLVPIVLALAAGRMVGWAAHLALCLRVFPRLRAGVELRAAIVPRLLSFGGWMTVSNLVSPLMSYLDRFLVGGLLSMAAVAHYATPYEVTSRLILPSIAVAGALFPLFAAGYAADRAATATLFARGVVAAGGVTFAIALGLTAFAHEGLLLWLGADFARASTGALQWLALGLFLNGVAQIPFGLLQAAARPDLAAKLHLIELPLYLVLVVVLTREFGISGTAAAWTMRVAVDAVALLVLAGRRFPAGELRLARIAAWVAAAVLALGLARLPAGLAGKSGVAGVALAGSALLAWWGVLDAGERTVLRARVRRARGVPSL